MNLIFFFIISLQTVCWGRKRIFKATKLGINKIQYKDNVGIAKLSTFLECYFDCSKNSKCLTFFYSVEKQICVLHSKTFQYKQPEDMESGWRMYLFEDVQSRCHHVPNGFLLYRYLNLCYNFNPLTVIDFDSFIKPKCASYGGALLKIDSEDKQNYTSFILQGRTADRVAIQGHSFNPGNVWTYDDGTPLVYNNWRQDPPAPKPGQWNAQIFLNDEWTEQNSYRATKNCIFLCEIV